MNIHTEKLRGPAESSPQEEAPRTSRVQAAAGVEVAGGRREGAAWEPQVSVGAEKLAGLVGRALRPCRPNPGNRLVSLATEFFLFIGTLSGLIIRSLRQLLLLAIVGK